MTVAPKITLPTPAGCRVLLNRAAGRSSDYGLSGRAAYGGLTRTLASLRHAKLLNADETLTQAGRMMARRLCELTLELVPQDWAALPDHRQLRHAEVQALQGLGLVEVAEDAGRLRWRRTVKAISMSGQQRHWMETAPGTWTPLPLGLRRDGDQFVALESDGLLEVRQADVPGKHRPSWEWRLAPGRATSTTVEG